MSFTRQRNVLRGARLLFSGVAIFGITPNLRSDNLTPGVVPLAIPHLFHQSERPIHNAIKCYFGTLHAHCSLSGDFSPAVSRNVIRNRLAMGMDEALKITNGPLAAFKHAGDNTRIDFLALTDHTHASGTNSDESMPDGAYAITLAAANAINNDPRYKEKFLAIPGMEWSTIGSGNHINIFFASKEAPRSIANGDIVNLRNRYLNSANFEKNNPLIVVQMNHPNQGGVNSGYGRNQFANGVVGDQAFVSDFREIYSGIEHINNSSQGNSNAGENNRHRDGDSLHGDYLRALNMGFRVAPIGDHDNHRKNWGRHTAARTGIWMRTLTPSGFAEAYRARRVFATEDNEMSVLFLADGHWMGEVVSLQGVSSRDQTFSVRIEQMQDTDTGQQQNEGPYVIALWGDEDGVGNTQARPRQIRVGGVSKMAFEVQQGETITFTRRIRPNSYYFLHVKERGGKDADGNQADAWTAPVFFTP